MALTKRTYVDGETIITAQNLNDIQDEVIAHESNKVPITRTVNSKALSSNITLSASDVGAVPTTRTVNGKALSSNITLTAANVGAVPTSRKVNNKQLSADITLSASDVGAAPTSHASTATTYGKGTSSNYGHVKISDSLTDTTTAATGGVVPSMKAVSDLNGAISAITPLDTTPTNGSTKGITSDAVFDAVNALNTKQIYTANWYAESSSASDINLTLYLALPKGVYLFVVGFPVLSSTALVQLVCTSGTIAQQVSNGVYGYTVAGSQTSWAGIFEVTSNSADFRVRSAQSTPFTMSYIERGFIRAVQLAKSST